MKNGAKVLILVVMEYTQWAENDTERVFDHES